MPAVEPSVLKRPAAKVLRKPAAATASSRMASRSRSPHGTPKKISELRAYVVNLERRPDRWARVQKMLETETPWLAFEHFAASDGKIRDIPEDEVTKTWNTKCNAQYADFEEWVFDEPDLPVHGKQWKWVADANAEEDKDWAFHDNEDGTGSVEKLATGEKFKIKQQFAQRYVDPGLVQNMSGGERGCAHSHLRMWRVAADREAHTLVLEDDVQFNFERSNAELGKFNGALFTERLGLALKSAPADFDVIYLGWAGWRGGHFKKWGPDNEDVLSEEARKVIRKAEYVWTTVAYVISQAGAKKLLAAASPLNQPVDNFMAWEASQNRLDAYVVLDEGDDDDLWAGGIVDQVDFQGDSDIAKSDGGVQGFNAEDFAASGC